MTVDAREKRLFRWWAVLVGLTLISLEGAPALRSRTLFAVTVLAIAFVKVRIVIREFMEVRGAPWILRFALDLWGIAICSTLIIMIA